MLLTSTSKWAPVRRREIRDVIPGWFDTSAPRWKSLQFQGYSRAWPIDALVIRLERSTCYNGRRTIIVRSDFFQNSLECSFVLPSARHLHSPIDYPVARIQRQRAGAYARQRRFGERRASKTNARVGLRWGHSLRKSICFSMCTGSAYWGHLSGKTLAISTNGTIRSESGRWREAAGQTAHSPNETLWNFGRGPPFSPPGF